MQDVVVKMSNIRKSFGLVHAVKESEFDLRKGEIHSLIGENGAGKSTMMKILYGLINADAGVIEIHNQEYSNLTPSQAIQLGIGMVHQEFMLIDNLTVLENLILGFEPKKGWRIDFDTARKEAQVYIDQYGLEIELDKKVHEISLAEAQRVEIIKTLMRGTEIIILDEPTAVLTPQETQGLFKILERLKEDKKSIVFISHKLNEVIQISDRISVMRQGKYIGTVNKLETDQAELARMMIGREVFMDIHKITKEPGEVLLKVEDLWTSGEKESSKVREISFEIRAGEIVGLAGIDGNGQSELAEALTGLRKVERGQVILSGQDITNYKPQQVVQAGVSQISEDRNVRGLNRQATLEENLIATRIEENPFSKHSIINNKKISEYGDKLVKKFDIRPPDLKIYTSALSGGNAQKVVVARAITDAKKILIAAQPTRGVDIGAIESIRNLIVDATQSGLGVLLISADLQEILSLSDRILVMYEGYIVGEILAEEANEENLGLLMMGAGKQVAHD